jgi:hypothetical protein
MKITEAYTKAESKDPILKAQGWEHANIRRDCSFTDGIKLHAGKGDKLADLVRPNNAGTTTESAKVFGEI